MKVWKQAQKRGLTSIYDITTEQMNELLHGLEMIMDQYPCRASELRTYHEDRVKLAKIEAMYLVLGGKL